MVIIKQYFPKVKNVISIPLSLIASFLISFIISYFRFGLKIFESIYYNDFYGFGNYIGVSFYLIVVLIIFALLKTKLWKKITITILSFIILCSISYITEFSRCGSGLFGDYSCEEGFETFCEVKQNIENFPVNIFPEIITNDKTHKPPYKFRLPYKDIYGSSLYETFNKKLN